MSGVGTLDQTAIPFVRTRRVMKRVTGYEIVCPGIMGKPKFRGYGTPAFGDSVRENAAWANREPGLNTQGNRLASSTVPSSPLPVPGAKAMKASASRRVSHETNRWAMLSLENHAVCSIVRPC